MSRILYINIVLWVKYDSFNYVLDNKIEVDYLLIFH